MAASEFGDAPRRPLDAPRPPLWVALFERLCAARGARLEVEPTYGYAGAIVAADGRRSVFKGTNFDINPAGAAALARDKDYAARFLSAAGLNVPRGLLVHAPQRIAAFELKNPAIAARLPDSEAALAFARDVGFPLYVKPNEGSEGDGVVKVADAAALTAALSGLCARHDRVLVQETVDGADLRLVVLDGAVRAAFLRAPLTIVGDGLSPVSALLAARLATFSAGGHGARIAVDDPRILAHLAASGRTLASVPAAGERIACLANANLSTGGTAEDVTDTLPPALAGLGARAAAALGLRFAGVDLLVEELSADTPRAVVLEVNAGPGLSYIHRQGGAAAARVEAIYADLLDAMLAG